MRIQSYARHAHRLLGATSMVALSAAAMIGAGQPAKAQAISTGLYGGGSTLASEAFRQIFDCYMGTEVGGDGFSSTTTFTYSPPSPGLIPNNCQTAAVEGLYAGVGSGNGLRGYIANDPTQWYGGTVTPNSTTTTIIATPFPAAQPPYTDSNNSNFASYPYPDVIAGFSDAPLNPTTAVSVPSQLTTVAFSFTTDNWTTTTQIGLNSTTQLVTYATSSFGAPVQLPAFEVPVAIPVNVNSSLFQINSQITSSGSIVPGGAVQLTEAQLCAIFSGTVTNWDDTTTSIAYLTSSSATPGSQLFDAANQGNGNGAQAYATGSLPITVVYRSDGSGTSFILTNFLHNVCPLLDTGTYPTGNGYAQIFGAGSGLPSTSFSTLINDIVAVKGNGVWNATTGTGHWLGESGSGGVAATISDSSAAAGYIGYVSADYTNPYSRPVTGGGFTNVDPPLSASLQDENQRINGTYLPSQSATTLTFIAPSPTSADDAWSDTAINAPDTNSTWVDYNVYGKTFAANTVHGSVTVSGLSVLPLTTVQGAYPLSGTTFMFLYSCYADDTVAGDPINGSGYLVNFLNWYYTPSDEGGDPNVQAIIYNSGFHPLNDIWSNAILNGYASLPTGNPTNNAIVSIAVQSQGEGNYGCTNVTGNGAN